MTSIVSFFFSSRRRHTRSSGDWSSDVCSSALDHFRKEDLQSRAHDLWRYHELLPVRSPQQIVTLGEGMTPILSLPNIGAEIGRAPCRERVKISVVDGGLKKKVA